MPSIRQSGRPNLQGWTPADASAQSAPEPRPQPTEVSELRRSPFMHAAMPLMATTSDAFIRQFYGQSNVPSQRILPAKKGAGS